MARVESAILVIRKTILVNSDIAGPKLEWKGAKVTVPCSKYFGPHPSIAHRTGTIVIQIIDLLSPSTVQLFDLLSPLIVQLVDLLSPSTFQQIHLLSPSTDAPPQLDRRH